MSSSALAEARYAAETDALRRELAAVSDQCDGYRREADRLRGVVASVQADHAQLIAVEVSKRSTAEAKLTQVNAVLEREQRLRRDAERSVSDVATDQKRHADYVSDLRMQFERRLTVLVEQLHSRDSEVNQLGFKLRELEAEKRRAEILDRQLQEARDRNNEMAETIDALKRTNSLLQVSPSRPPSEASPHSPSPPPPPPPPPAPPVPMNDPHVAEAARMLVTCRDWFKEIARDCVALQSGIEDLSQSAADIGCVFERGRSGAGLELAASDRRRMARRRDLETSHLADQIAELESIVPTTTVIRAAYSDVKFKLTRVAECVKSSNEALLGVREIADRHLGTMGLPQIVAKLERLTALPPSLPLPLPGYQPQAAGAPAAPLSHPQSQSLRPDPAVAAATAAHEAELQMLRDRIGSLESTVSQMTLQADAVKATHRAKVEELEALLLVQRQKGFDDARRAESDADERIATVRSDAQRRFDDLEKRYIEMRDSKERDLQQQRQHHEEAMRALQQAFDADRTALTQRFEEANDALHEAEDQVQQLQGLLEQSRARRKKAEAELATLQSAGAESAVQVEQLATELGVAREAVIELSRQVMVLREQQTKLEAQAAARSDAARSQHTDPTGPSDALSEWRRARGVPVATAMGPAPTQTASARHSTPTVRGATPRRAQFVKVDSLVSPTGPSQSSFPARPKR